MQRKLATILVGDIVGSTNQMEVNEETAVSEFQSCLSAVSEQIDAHEGRVFNRAGDAVFAEFSSPVNALRAAMEARSTLAARQSDVRQQMRFGLHLADVVQVEDDLRGDGVNVAARIQTSADPGAIDSSESLFSQVRRNSPCVFDDLGPRALKGISEPMRIYRVRDRLDGARRGGPSTVYSGQAAALPKRAHSIAVLPLSTASSASEDQHFLAEGLTEDIALELGRHSQLFVISYTASLPFAGKSATEAGTALGVRYVLSGSVRMLGNRLRLNLTLSETDTGRVVWTDRMQSGVTDFVDIMDDVIQRVGATVLGRVMDADMSVARNRKPANLSAYEAYLRGLDYHRRGGVTDENIRKAMAWFEKAMDLDPNFARAQAMWVCSASWLPDYDWDDGRLRVARAIELDANDPEAQRIYGAILLKEGRYDESRAYHENALRLAPNDAYILGRAAAFYTFSGDPDRALELLDRAEALDPLLPTWITEERIAALYAQDQLTECLSEMRKLPIQTRRGRMYRAACLQALDQPDAARAVVAELLDGAPGVNTEWVQTNECYRDPAIRATLLDRLIAAGIPA